MPQFAQFFGRHRNLVRTTPPKNRNFLRFCSFQHVERMTDNVRSAQLGPGFRKYTADIQRDIAITNYRHMSAIERRFQIGKIRMAIVPTDEGGASENAWQVRTWYLKVAIIGRASGQNHRIIYLK